MFDNLHDDIILYLSKFLSIKDFLAFARTNKHNHFLSQCASYFSERYKKYCVPSNINTLLNDYAAYCQRRIERIQQELAFFEKKRLVLHPLIEYERIEPLIRDHLHQFILTGDDRLLFEIEQTLDELNAEIIERQLPENHEPQLTLHNISRLPKEILFTHQARFLALQGLVVKGNCLETLPEEITMCENLETLNLYNNPITSLPISLSKMAALRNLYMSHGNLKKLPEALYNLTNLRFLSLMNMQLEEISPDIAKMTQLTWLYLRRNNLRTLPRQFCQLEKLNYCYLDNNHLQIHQPPGTLTYLRQKNIRFSQLLQTQEQEAASSTPKRRPRLSASCNPAINDLNTQMGRMWL